MIDANAWKPLIDSCFNTTNKVFHHLGPAYRPKPEQPPPLHLENPERVFHS